ncbi:MAG: PAS domain S-box protein [Candidatus Hydrogenedentes bacterium]|nr:PAS domain S-box protein [Candidatus Hydrogenedentota bacterium]
MLEQREQLYRTLFENGNDAIVLMEGNRAIDCNQKALDMFRCSRAQLMGAETREFSPEFQPDGQSSESLSNTLLDRVRSGTTLQVEWRYKRLNGDQFDADVRVTALSLDGRTYGMAIIQDLSQRKATEAELAKTRSLLETAIEQSPAGIIIADAPDGRIRVANRVTVADSDNPEMLHHALKDLQALHARTFLPDGSPLTDANSPLAQAIQAGKVSRNVEVLMQVSDKHRRTVLVNAAPIRDNTGAIIAGVSVFHDITEHRQLEQQLRQAQKMEAIGQLAGGVAHDFNNILQAILGYGEMAMEQAIPGSELHLELLEVRKAAERAVALVRQLLAFSRRQVLDLQVVNLDRVIHDLVKMIVRVIGEDITLNVRTRPGLRTIRADRGQLEQVLMNLCINARDAMCDGGEITIRTENVEISEHYCQLAVDAKPGLHVLLTISDTGCGMDAEVQKHIFEPFFSTKEQSKGTGLGLATVYGIVRQHGGFINVYSEPEHGTVFKIYFPVVDEALTDPAVPGETEAKGGAETILLAEDNPDVRALAQITLERAGYTVLNAANGEEAVSLYDAHRDAIQLALLDVVMPQIGGIAVSDHIHETRPEIPIVFASGYSADSSRSSFTLGPRTCLIEKPYDRNTLLRTIRAALDASTTIPS